MLFREIIAVYSGNLMKPMNLLCGQNAELLNVKARDTYSYHWAFRVKYFDHILRALCDMCKCKYYNVNFMISRSSGRVV
jgi:hypothetical protein